MIPLGYLAKRVVPPPDWLVAAAGSGVHDVCSVSGCVNSNFHDDYISCWKHNGFWFFDSPALLRETARELGVDLDGTTLFFYEGHPFEYDSDIGEWEPYVAEPSLPTSVVEPARTKLLGFDVVTFWAGNAPECSPLSCNCLAATLPVNEHCLFATFDQARRHLENGDIRNAEPGPYRIHAVHTLEWPEYEANTVD